MTDDERQTLAQTLDSLERLMRMFQAERVLYLCCAFAGFGLLVYAGVLMFKSGKVDFTQFGLIFGSTGFLSVASGRVVFFLNRSFNLIEDIVRKLAGLPGRAA